MKYGRTSVLFILIPVIFCAAFNASAQQKAAPAKKDPQAQKNARPQPAPKVVVARVNGTEIQEDYFNAVLERFLEDFRKFNPGSPVDEETKNWAKKYVLDEFIKRDLLIQEARKKGFRVNDDVVDKVIKDHPYFKDKNGKFDNTKFLWAMNDPNFNIKEVREQVRSDDELVYQEFLKSMMEKEKATDAEVFEEFKKRSEKVVVNVAVVKTEPLPDTSVTGAELASYFSSHKEKYMFPPRVKAKYLLVTPEKVRNGITVSDAEIEKYYKDNKDEFYLSERIKLSHIQVAIPPDADTKAIAEKKAVIDKALALLNSGESFSALAKQYSEDRRTAEEGGSIRGYIPRGRLGDLDEKLFSLKTGQYTKEAVKTPWGFHIFRLDNRKDEGTGSLDEVIDSVRNAILKAKSESLAEETAKKIADRARNITDLESMAGPFGGLVETPLFAEKDSLDTIGYIPEFNSAAFALKKGGIDPKAVTMEWRPKKIMGYAVIAVTDRIDSAVPSIDEIKPSLLADCKSSREKELTRQKADGIIARLRYSADFLRSADQEGCDTKQITVTRYQYYIDGVGYAPGLVSSSFDSTPQEAGPVKNNEIYSVDIPNGICIYKPVEKVGVDEKAYAKEKNNLQKSLTQQKNSAAFEKWFESAKKSAKIEIFIKTE